VARLPFLHPGLRGATGEATAVPDAPRPKRQLDPNDYGVQVTYTMSSGSASGSAPPSGVASFGRVYATSDTPMWISMIQTNPQSEYWYLDSVMVAQHRSAPGLAFAAAPLSGSEANYVSPTFPAPMNGLIYKEAPNWKTVTDWKEPKTGQKSYIFQGQDNDGMMVYLQLILDDGNDKIDGIYWYLPAQMNAVSPSGAFVWFAGPFPCGSWHRNTNKPVPPDMLYVIMSQQDNAYGLGLNLSQGDIPGAGTPVVLGTSTSKSAPLARWLMDSSTGRIHLAGNPNLVIDVQGSGTDVTKGSPLVLCYYDASRKSQQWTWGDSEKYIINTCKYDGNALVMDNADKTVEAGNPIIVYTIDNPSQPNQQWDWTQPPAAHG
jgi:hypothetical protein